MRHRALFLLAIFTGNLAVSAQAAEPQADELEAVVVTAPSEEKVRETAVPATVLSGDALRTNMGHTIGETLKQQPGITSQSFGPGVGTPVIRGQSGPRVRVLANGIGSNDVSAISPDHAISSEPLLAERIEVLRGPATLLYGSGAIGGVVNIIDGRIPSAPPDPLFGGAFEQRYDSVADETASALKVEGGAGHLAYHLDGFYRERNTMRIGGQAIDEAAARASDPTLPANLQNSRGLLPNSWGHTAGGSAGASWVGDGGFAGVSINRLENNYGIPPDGTGAEITRIDLRQNKYDFQSAWKHPFAFADALKMRLGYTDYQHTELPNGVPGSFYTNKTYEARAELTHEPVGPLHGTLGFQAISSDFAAIDKSTGTALVPRSQIGQFAAFAVENFDIAAIACQLGLRVENASIAPQGLSSLSYTPVSASASALWKVDGHHSLNLALTRSQRAPQVQELLAKGYHDATRSYELGNLGLREETSYNLDLGYRFRSDRVRAEFDLFHNWASDYIFQQRNGRFVTEAGAACAPGTACPPVVVTRQADATFKGFEGKLVFSLMENRYGLVDLTLFSDYTRGQFVRGADVPRLPPLRYGFQLDYDLEEWSANVRLTRAEPQNHPGDYDTPTRGYLLLAIGAQYRVKAFERTELLLFVKGNNLLNQNIRNATSYLRNFAPEPGRGGELAIRVSF